jgi:hypothetical protein
VVKALGETIVGVAGPETNVQVGPPTPALFSIPPTRVVLDPQTRALPPAFTLQSCPNKRDGIKRAKNNAIIKVLLIRDILAVRKEFK